MAPVASLLTVMVDESMLMIVPVSDFETNSSEDDSSESVLGFVNSKLLSFSLNLMLLRFELMSGKVQLDPQAKFQLAVNFDCSRSSVSHCFLDPFPALD